METKTVRSYIKENLTVEEYALVAAEATEEWDRTLDDCRVYILHRSNKIEVMITDRDESLGKTIDNYLEELIKPADQELLEISKQLTELANKLKQLSIK